MINPQQLLDCVIYPVLNRLSLPSDLPSKGLAAAQLLLGTAMQESECGTWLTQISGPARGIWQMEPVTLQSHLDWLDDRNDLFLVAVTNLTMPLKPLAVQLEGNLYFACAMARIHYYRVAAPLPAVDDTLAQAHYYKQYYNTPAGAATVTQYMQNWTIVSKEISRWA